MKQVLYALTLFTLFSLPAFAPTFAQDKPAPPAPAKHATGYKPLTPAQRAAVHADRAKAVGRRMQAVVEASTPPAVFDAKDMGWTVPPGDQAQCGSCYLYSTVKTMSNAAVKAGLGKADTFRLATQYGMDSPRDFGGCNGGNGTEVIAWALKNGWVAEADPSQPASALYPPYEARSGRDRTPAGAKRFTPKNWFFITSDQSDRPATVDEYKAALLAYGTVNVAIDAGGQFGSYSGGVISSMGSSIDHEIQIRGWDDSKQALLFENQWAGWGGAKSPGDNCAWVSYKAVGAIQDPFVVVFDSPTPPVPPVPPVPPAPPVPPVPPTPGQVTIGLTPEQVASVNAQSGATVITGATTIQQIVDMVNAQSGTVIIDANMTLKQIIEAVERKKAGKPCCDPKPAPPKKDDQTDALRLAKDVAELRQAVDEIMKALLAGK